MGIAKPRFYTGGNELSSPSAKSCEAESLKCTPHAPREEGSVKLVAKTSTPPKKAKPAGLAPLVGELRRLIESARHAAAGAVNTLQVLTNFEIGRRIVEFEQEGAKRAAYGDELLKELSIRLTEEFGRGFSRTNLQAMRNFFLAWQDRVPRICQKPSGKSFIAEMAQSPAARPTICRKPSGKLVAVKKGQTVSDLRAICQTPSEGYKGVGSLYLDRRPAKGSFLLTRPRSVEQKAIKGSYKGVGSLYLDRRPAKGSFLLTRPRSVEQR
jgi:hypothetical protein